MVYYCFVKSCRNSTYAEKRKSCGEPVTWHGLPKDIELQKKWAQALGVKDIPKSSRICSEHFSQDCFQQIGFSKIRLKPNTVPLIHITPRARSDSNTSRDSLVENDAVIENTLESAEKALERNSIAPVSLHSPVKSEGLQEMSSNVINKENNIISKTPTKSTASTIRYPGDINEEKVLKMSPRTIVKSMQKLQKSCKDKASLIQRLKKTQRSQLKKIETMQQLLTDLRKNHLISSNAHDVLEAMTPDDRNIADDIRKGKVQEKYPAHLRSFALTLHFYSPRAYNYVRQAYQNKLPAPSTIRSWYSNTDGSPGITREAIDALKNKTNNAPGKKIYACLMADEMAIRKQAEWNHSQKRFDGYVDLGTMIPEPEHLPLAKEALVYLVTGVNERWKIPVAYFLVSGLTAEEKAEITRQVLISIAATGVSIIALTFDGLPANIAMCSTLAADVYNNKPYFPHPLDDNFKVRVLFDAAHMAKLIRNILASKKILYDPDNNPIEWKYIEELVEIQRISGCHLANKINKKHLEWEKNKMSVKLATQTLSESVAIALKQLLEDGHKYFVDCAPTIKFILMVNYSFDCLNSRSLFSNRFKRPIMDETAGEIFSFFQEARSYFAGIKLQQNGKSIIETRSKTGFLGFFIDMQNFEDIYNDHVRNGTLKYILTYKFSQDHLEIFFSCIRSMGRFNNNPNSTQFMAAYKRLLLRNEVKSSSAANCIALDNTNILTVSSRRANAEVQSTQEDIAPINLDAVPLKYIDPVAHHCVSYMAGFVERKLFHVVKCETCIILLRECTPMKSSFIDNKSWGFLHYPSVDTHQIATVTEKVINWYRLDNTLTDSNVCSRIFLNVMRNLNYDSVFNNFEEHIKNLESGENHKYYLIKLIVDLYVKIKLSYYGKDLTRREQGQAVRHVLNKTILFKGQ